MKKNTSIPVLREIHQLMSVTDTKTQRIYLYQCIPVNLRLLLPALNHWRVHLTVWKALMHSTRMTQKVMG